MTGTRYRLTVCADCLDADANGYPNPNADPTHTPDREPLSLLAPGTLLGPDVPALSGEDDYDAWSDGYFSWSPCGACGSTLGGTRWDMLAVEVTS